MNRIVVVILALGLSGCFDSIVSDPCATGFHLSSGQCVVGDATDAGTGSGDDAGDPGGGRDGGSGSGDAGSGEGGDGGQSLTCPIPDVLCEGECVDLSSDPDNCGACGRVCVSGICQDSHCVGELSGHIVAIGHDYTSYNGAMARVLGNAVALGAAHDIGVARLHGTATAASKAATTTAMTQSLSNLGRPFHTVTIPTTPSPSALAAVHVLVVDAQTGDGNAARATGVAWAQAIDLFLQRGGIVVVLEGAGGVSHRFADGAALYSVAADPVDTTGIPALVVVGSDAVVQQVVSPYLADTTSVVLPGLTGVVTTPLGSVVAHTTRY